MTKIQTLHVKQQKKINVSTDQEIIVHKHNYLYCFDVVSRCNERVEKEVVSRDYFELDPTALRIESRIARSILKQPLETTSFSAFSLHLEKTSKQINNCVFFFTIIFRFVLTFIFFYCFTCNDCIQIVALVLVYSKLIGG